MDIEGRGSSWWLCRALLSLHTAAKCYASEKN